METKHLKKYAPEARREFIEAVTNKAAVYGLLPKGKVLPMQEEGDVVIIGDRPFPRSVAKQRKELEERIRKEGFQQFIEAIAYTWFNRFVAIRYMELHGYLDHGYRVLSHPEGKSPPEILENAERIELPGLKRDEVVDLKLDGGKDEQLYQMLLLAQCNALHKAMPFLFESIKDGTELLLPDNLLHTDSLVRTLVDEIPEEQWENVEIIGWLYQFYISEKKDEVIGKVVKSEDIPAATQLFTPNWIVKYLVQNSLGRQWVATYPDSPLKQQMEFYIEPAEQTPEVQQQLDEITPDSLNPEELTLLDPACGSGHILVEAYDLFKAIYTERGYRPRDIPKLILTKNLYGLEIDDRAAQLTAFALMMKARADDRGIFGRDVQPNVLSIQESKGLDSEAITEALNQSLSDESTGVILRKDVAHLIELFEHGNTFGSLIEIPEMLAENMPALTQRVTDVISRGGMFEQALARELRPLVTQAQLLSSTYHHVVTNPPYMNSKHFTKQLKETLRDWVKGFDGDLFSAFILRCSTFATDHGHVGVMCPFVWMFINSHEALRCRVVTRNTLESLIQLEYSGFSEAAVPICTFVFSNHHTPAFNASFIRLTDFRGADQQPTKTLEAITHPEVPWFYTETPDVFQQFPYYVIGYWCSDEVKSAFASGISLGNLASPCEGMTTGDTNRFIRRWHEVSIANTEFRASDSSSSLASDAKWYPYCKGGEFRKWYGNHEHVVNWKHDGEELRAFGRSYPRNLDKFFKQGLTWTKVSSSYFSVRLMDKGFAFDTGGLAAFPPSEWKNTIAGFLNSHVARTFLAVLNPTLNFTVGGVSGLPFLKDSLQRCRSEVESLVSRAFVLAKSDWDSQESSWEFLQPAIMDSSDSIAGGYAKWATDCHERNQEMLEIETENNRLFINAYGLQNELSPEVPDDQLTLYCPDREEDVKRLVSYAIGCMMGRYSLDEPGLIYADSGNEGFDPSQYSTFPADEDGIVPLTDISWFPDDAANRFEQFIKAAWPEEHLEENLTFVAESLGKKKGETSRDCIRRYLATGFYKHHLSMYKKRPIYWLFSSGKQRAFQCLVYLHRHNAGTLSRMRTEYVVKLQGKINSRIDQLEDDIPAANSTSHRKKLEKERDNLIKQREELQEFDEKLRHYADHRIELDLDDGVKVNYGKFGDLLAEVKTITGEKPIVEVTT